LVTDTFGVLTSVIDWLRICWFQWLCAVESTA